MLSLLLALNVASVIIIFQVDLGLLPLLSSKLDAERVQRVNNLFSNLSQGVLVSTLFYFLLVVAPERKKAKRISALVSLKVNTIISALEQSILFLMHKTKNSSKKIQELTPEDMSSITKITNEKMLFNYQVKSRDGLNWINFSTGDVTEINHFVQEREMVLKKIDEILSLPHIVDENIGLIDTLCKLKDSWFYSGVISYAQYGERSTVDGFSEGVYDYYKLFISLKNMGIGNQTILRS